MEFGIHESLPLFAGGLGVLAGDHLKAASDLDMPLVGVGLLYRQGYFHQYLDHNGWQQEDYPETDLYHLPLRGHKDADGQRTGHRGRRSRRPRSAPTSGRSRRAASPCTCWTPTSRKTHPQIRDITARLYGGEHRVRLAQEVLLGIGGMRALTPWASNPTVCHMNEGHCAFSSLERLAQIMAAATASTWTPPWRSCRARTVFTTHTPVPAGHDEFPADLVRPTSSRSTIAWNMPIDEHALLGTARGRGADGPFSMFVLGLRMAQYINGVSQLHGQVARQMWPTSGPSGPTTKSPSPTSPTASTSPLGSRRKSRPLFERYLGPQLA